MTAHQEIRNAIDTTLSGGERKFIICPFGDYGMLAKRILNDCFGIKEKYIIDNRLSKYNPCIQNIDYFRNKDMSAYTVLLVCADLNVHTEILKMLQSVFDTKNIVDVFPVDLFCVKKLSTRKAGTKCGKYSYGPLCDHDLVESVGAFCSFAAGTDVVHNHVTQYISTHPFLYHDRECNDIYQEKYEDCNTQPWYFPGVKPKGKVLKLRKITIGSDVWLGRNVIITNGANIGNGVIAAAGAVITKDIPDYAVVAGVPARIIKYRFLPYQIDALNKIAWWNWSDEKIRECYDDFFGDIDVFIRKYKN